MRKLTSLDLIFISPRMGALLILLLASALALMLFIYAPQNKPTAYGVTFSKPFAEELGLDWRVTYVSMLDELKVKKLRLPVYWTEVEKTPDNFSFQEVDWQIAEAQKRDVEVILVVGQKQPRWPECHLPAWTQNQTSSQREEAALKAIITIVQHYKNEPNVKAWQVENEPFLDYGENCPPLNPRFLDREVAVVRSLDPTRPIMLTDSGELNNWYQPAKRADILGITMYRVVWDKKFGYVHYPFDYIFYRLKGSIIKRITSAHQIIVTELQAEPWGGKSILEMTVAEQKKSMNVQEFQKNVKFTHDAGYAEVYLWGAEWWYWLKTKQNDFSMWEAARELFVS